MYGADVAAATSVARRLRTGAVNVNTAVFSAYAPGGGYKESGLGRERGTDGIRAFQEVKHMAIGELPAELEGGGATTTELSLDWLISVDDHVLEPPHLWVDRVAAKDRDRAPHQVVEGDMEFWVYDGKRYPSSGLSAVAGKKKEEFSPEPVTYAEMRPGCYDARRASRTWTAPASSPRCASRRSRASAGSSSWRRATGTSASCACRPTTTG